MSTEEQSREGHAGLQRQRAQTDQIIASRGFTVVASFEVIVSGTSVEHTPAFKEMVALIQQGVVGAVVCSEVSRLMRVDSWESLAVLDTFARHGVHIVADGIDIDFSNPEGFLSGGIQTLLAGHERMKLLQKINASKTALKREGKLASADHTLPLGLVYDRKTHRFAWGPEIGRVQEAFRLVDEEGIDNLAEIGRRVGIKRTTLRGILANQVYTGVRRYDTKRDPNAKRVGPDGKVRDRRKVKCAADEIIEVQIIPEPAIAPARFARVQKVLENLRLNHLATLPVEKFVHLCTGAGRCGFCGQPLYITGNGKRDPVTGRPKTWYCCKSQHPGRRGTLPRCPNSWPPRHRLDALLLAFAEKVLCDVDLLGALISGSFERTAEVVRPFPAPVEDPIAKLERKEKRLIQMCAENALSIDELRTQRAAIHKEINQLRASKPAEEKSAETLTVEELARGVVKGALRLRRLTCPREQKAVLQQLFSEVFFRGESITAFRFGNGLIGAVDPAGGADYGQVVNLPAPFRITEEVPEGSRRCSKCAIIYPNAEFKKDRCICRVCRRRATRESRLPAGG